MWTGYLLIKREVGNIKKTILLSITAITSMFLLLIKLFKHRSNESFPINKAGKPDLDHLDNAKMVSEGSQYGVQYYNEVVQD
ncbi:hypothetical protein ACLIA0_02050 [Bacillaceae bacterium W0354]